MISGADEHHWASDQTVGQHRRWAHLRWCDALGIAHHTLTDEVTMPFIVDRSIKQAFMTQASVA